MPTETTANQREATSSSTRRKLLGAVGATVTTAFAGCSTLVPNTTIALQDTSTYFKTITYHKHVMLIYNLSTVTVELRDEPPSSVTAVVLLYDGEQTAHETVATGETKTELEIGSIPDDVRTGKHAASLIAVTGGEEQRNGDITKWVNGEVLERTEITITTETNQ